MPQLRNPWGYGLYFTDSRLIGVSYKKIVSRAFLPGLILFLIWVVALVSVITYGRIAGIPSSEPIGPGIILGPLLVGPLVLSLLYLLYLGPKHAASRTESQLVNSIWELESLRKDLVIQRIDVSQVSIQGRRFYDPWGGGIVLGSAVNVNLRTGQIIMFVNALRGERLRRLFGLLQDFCAQEPSIAFSTSSSSLTRKLFKISR